MNEMTTYETVASLIALFAYLTSFIASVALFSSIARAWDAGRQLSTEGFAPLTGGDPVSDVATLTDPAPYDRRLHSSFFHLRNPLSLFYPFRTSVDDMHITLAMQAAFDASLGHRD
jgi:hypothetical protein